MTAFRFADFIVRRRRASRAWRAIALVYAFVFAGLNGCGGETPVENGTPTSVEPASSTAVSGIAAMIVNPVPQVLVRDDATRPVRGVLVRWRVLSGGGRVANDTSRTNASGIATAGAWTLGSTLGLQELNAEVEGVGNVRFIAQAGSGPLARLVRLTPDPQTAVVGQAVPLPPSVRAEDAQGTPIAGVAVTFSVVSGGGTIDGPEQITGVNGVATANSWTLGPTRGQHLARATANGQSVTFSANAQADVPASIEIVSGNDQSGTTGIALQQPVVVRVVDRFGNPVAGVSVVATPGPGSGSVAPVSATTSEQGIAAFVWTLGTANVQTLTFSVAGTSGVTAQVSATRVATNFSITVRYVEFTPNARQQLAVDRAVARLTTAIVGSSGTSQVNIPAGSCGRTWMPAVNEVITNLVIYARIGTIDGSPPNNNIIGNANVCALHGASGLPVVGTLLLDSDDLALLESNGLVDPLVLHEMGHTVGIGTLWNGPLLVREPASDPYFTGAAANAGFLAIGGSAYTGNKVPVECSGCVGPGSDFAHWRESVLGREIMTSILQSGSNPFSAVSVGSLQDIGYVVSLAAADPFQLTFADFLRRFEISSSGQLHLRGDVLPMIPLPPGASVRDVIPAPRRR